MTDFKFSMNQIPLRFIANGKYQFYPIYYKTAAAGKIVDLKCKKNHVLSTSVESYWYYKCSLCQKVDMKYICSICKFYCCESCFENDKFSKEKDRDDPQKHENATFLRCSIGCSFSLQIPVAGGANGKNGSYTISMELRFEKLPPTGKIQSLLRFTLPDLAKARNIHRASVYLNGDGYVVGRPIENGGSIADENVKNFEQFDAKLLSATYPTSRNNNTSFNNMNDEGSRTNLIKSQSSRQIIHMSNSTKDLNKQQQDEEQIIANVNVDNNITLNKIQKIKNEKETHEKNNHSDTITVNKQKNKQHKVHIRAGIWYIVSVVVEPEKCMLSTYVNGKLCHRSTDLEAIDLRLNHKIVVLGGGKQANVRGADIRRLTVHSACLDAENIEKVYFYLANEHPGIGDRILKIQAVYRGFITRKNCVFKKKK